MASLTKGSATTSGTKIDQVIFNFLFFFMKSFFDIWKSLETKEKNWTKKKSFETTINRTPTANYESLQARGS